MLGPEEVVDQIVTRSVDQIEEKTQNMYGIIPRAIRHFFDGINHSIEQEGSQYQIGLNYFEIYNENIINLLSDDQNENLTIIENRVLNAPPNIVDSPE